MENAEAQKIGTIIKKLEALKKAKKKYWDKWPDLPFSGAPDLLGKPYWQKYVEPLVTEVLCDIEKIDGVFFITHWPNFYPPLDPSEEVLSRDPDRMDEPIQRFKVMQRGVEKADEEGKKRKSKAVKISPKTTPTPNIAVTLDEFMQQYCGDCPSPNRLVSLRKSLQYAGRTDLVQLPKCIGKWKTGQPKRYNPQDLSKQWPNFREKLSQLPLLKSSQQTQTELESTTE